MAQTTAVKKQIAAQRTAQRIVIDGQFTELDWNNASKAKDFVMFQPDNGKAESANETTEVRFLYDDEGIYIAAILHQNPATILKEITQRDNFGSSEHFGIFINGFNDGQQDFRFFVSAAGTQMDCLATPFNGEDFSWDAIWESAVSITENAWQVEMKIPYAAIRFAKKEVQTWGINMLRERQEFKQKFTWNYIDSRIGNVFQQAGTLTNIEKISPPIRLFLLPYTSGYVNYFDGKLTSKPKIGMDIKYGINDSFTLDAILIPDFGQTAFDNAILNLGPFEQQLNENRSFFTEGTDLFAKGNLFYSRRIGSRPSHSATTRANEIITDAPKSVNLLNALKISGRTKDGLGVGVLNAITEKTYATIKDTLNNQYRKELIEPFTNYNVTVIDQRFRKNSSVTFINTDVIRNGNFRDANVSGLLFDLNTKANTYKLAGEMKWSYVNKGFAQKGQNAFLNFAKTAGQWRYNIGGNYVSKDYNINDLGINFITNFYNTFGGLSYRTLNPTKVFNAINTRINYNLEWENSTQKLQDFRINYNLNLTTLKNHDYGLGINATPSKTYDFYQTRTTGRYLQQPENVNIWGYISTNYNYTFAIDINPFVTIFNQNKRQSYGLGIGPRYRFNDKLFFEYKIDYYTDKNDKGYADTDNNQIIFSNRDVTTLENTIGGKYAINSQMTFNLKIRHYWSFSEIKNYLTLLPNGTLAANNSYQQNLNDNFNSWNFDLSYQWWFAPGSQISVLYRNNGQNYTNNINKQFYNNLNQTFQNNLNHTLSISVKYLIDYNKAKKWF